MSDRLFSDGLGEVPLFLAPIDLLADDTVEAHAVWDADHNLSYVMDRVIRDGMVVWSRA